MLSEIITTFSNEPILIFPALSPLLLGIVLITFLCKKQIKQCMANVVSHCIKKPTWGEDEPSLDEILEFCSHTKVLTDLTRRNKELEIKIKDFESITKVIPRPSNKLQIITPKGIVIKIGKFKSKKIPNETHLSGNIILERKYGNSQDM